MKKKLISILLAVMTISASVPAFAAPSISQIIPEAPKVVEGNLKAGEELVVQDVKTEEYKKVTVNVLQTEWILIIIGLTKWRK